MVWRRAMVVALLLALTSSTHAQTYWTGSSINFTNPGDGSTDILTSIVILTRGTNGQGLFNIAAQPDAETGAPPPAGTQWGVGTLAGYMSDPSSVSFGNCPLEQGQSPGGDVGTNYVVHLVTNNIYLELTLTFWGGQGGNPPLNYSYTRSTPAIAIPPTVSITNPLNNAFFAAPANVPIGATASVGSGTVTNVQFFTNNASLGSVKTAPFTLTANSLGVGAYALTAAATAAGISTTSSVVNISVVTPVAVTLTNAKASSGTSFKFNYSANVGLSYLVQRATNLLAPNWISLATNLAASNPTNFLDNHATNNPLYYRVGRLPNP